MGAVGKQRHFVTGASTTAFLKRAELETDFQSVIVTDRSRDTSRSGKAVSA